MGCWIGGIDLSPASQPRMLSIGETTYGIFSPRVGGNIDVLRVETSPLRVMCGSTSSGILSECSLQSEAVKYSLTSHLGQHLDVAVTFIHFDGPHRVLFGHTDGRLLMFSRATTPATTQGSPARDWKKRVYPQEYHPRPGCASTSQGRTLVVDLFNVVHMYELDGTVESVGAFPLESNPEVAVSSICHDPVRHSVIVGFRDGRILATNYVGYPSR